jgi:hypothetical protein
MPDLPGMFAGFVGLISLIGRNWISHPNVHVVVWVFVGLFALILLLVIVAFAFVMSNDDSESLTSVAYIISSLAFTLLLSPFFCDLSLGAMTNNWLGTPSRASSGLYWSYFILERLTLLIS